MQNVGPGLNKGVGGVFICFLWTYHDQLPHLPASVTAADLSTVPPLLPMDNCSLKLQARMNLPFLILSSSVMKGVLNKGENTRRCEHSLSLSPNIPGLVDGLYRQCNILNVLFLLKVLNACCVWISISFSRFGWISIIISLTHFSMPQTYFSNLCFLSLIPGIPRLGLLLVV